MKGWARSNTPKPGPALADYRVGQANGGSTTVAGAAMFQVEGSNLVFYATSDATGAALATLPLTGATAVASITPLPPAAPVVAVSNAATAAATATAAQAAALTASTDAAAALTAANGKNQITYSTANPSGSGTRAGDIWWKRTVAGLIVGTWEWDGAAWQPRTFDDAVFATISAAKIVTGTLQAGTSITAGSPTGNRLVLSSTGLQGVTVSGGVPSTTLDYNVATGNLDVMGRFRTQSVASRSVVVSSDIGVDGGNVNQPGILFRNATSVNRWAEMYSTNSDIIIDGPAYTDVNGVAHLGASWRVNIEGLYGYTQGSDGGVDTFRLVNDGTWRLGPYQAGAGSTQTRVEGSATAWAIGNAVNGTKATGDSTGAWTLGALNNTALPRIYGNANTSWFMGHSDVRTFCNADGTWGVGHATGQSVYSTSTELVLRGRQVVNNGGPVGMYLAAGNFFTVNAADNGATQGGMYVNGRFGAAIKSFVIDHPTKPERNLVHVSTESPVAGVEYWGAVDLNDKGEAVVPLPDYFEALTHTDGRVVLLTVVGKPAAVGASEVVDGQFTVYGPKSGRVSWLVKAARKDSYSVFEVEPLKKSNQGREDLGDAPPPPTDPEAPSQDGPTEEPPKGNPKPGGKHGEPVENAEGVKR